MFVVFLPRLFASPLQQVSSKSNFKVSISMLSAWLEGSEQDWQDKAGSSQATLTVRVCAARASRHTNRLPLEHYHFVDAASERGREGRKIVHLSLQATMLKRMKGMQRV